MDSEVDNAIRPFQFDAPEEALADLRRRIAATHWPDRETVADPSQGVQLVTMQELARYWGTDYDWRKVEARLSAWLFWNGALPEKGQWHRIADEIGVTPEAFYRELAKRERT